MFPLHSTYSVQPLHVMTSSNGNLSVLLALCAGNSPMTGEFPLQRPVTRSFDVSSICASVNDWVNNSEADDLRRNRSHYDVAVMWMSPLHSTYSVLHLPAAAHGALTVASACVTGSRQCHWQPALPACVTLDTIVSQLRMTSAGHEGHSSLATRRFNQITISLNKTNVCLLYFYSMSMTLQWR